MLYANSSSAGFSELASALSALGADSESMNVFDRFMDLANPCDITLLKNVHRIDLSGPLDWKKVEALDKATRRELVRPNDEEAIYRYANFAYALGGSMCWRIFKIMNDMKTDTYFYRAFKEKFDDAHKPYAKAAAYGIKICQATLRNGFYNMPSKEDADTCLKAVETLEKDKLKAKCLLITYALDSLERGDAQVQTALEMLKEARHYSTTITLDNGYYAYLLCAYAEASYFDESFLTLLKQTLKSLDPANAYMTLIGALSGLNINSKRVYETLENDPEIVTPEYILNVKGKLWHKQKLAKQYPDVFTEAIKGCGDIILALELENIMIDEGLPYDKEQIDLRGKTQSRVTEALSNCFPMGDEIREYLNGERTLADTMPAISAGKIEPFRNRTSLAALNKSTYNYLNYYTAFGRDEFIARAITLTMLADTGYGRFYRIDEYTGFEINKVESIKPAIEMLTESGSDYTQAIQAVALCVDDMYTMSDKCLNAAVDTLQEHMEGLKSVDTKKLGATARVIYTKAIGRRPDEFKQQLLALADDGSKAVRAELADILAGQTGWADDIAALLNAKKGAKRELALEIIFKQGADGYTDALQAAFDKEKSEKIKVKIGALIGAKVEGKPAAELTLEQRLEKLIKSSKSSKLGFLFERPFKPVHKKDGSEASEDVLRALVMCYSSFVTPTRSQLADDIAAELNGSELEAFAAEIFGRWCDNGAQAKQKSVLYFCACHGGLPMVRTFMSYIKSWAENMRGAIAAEAVKAMALGGSSEALMNIDNMSRKFKNKQVRAAAGEALANAADALGITTEELADKIVPDLGFDKNLCREFDYGSRQFKVYITPALELECFNGDKKIKTLPKPGANDDEAKANAALADFKEMKKQLKNVITAQRARLEYVLMCDRKWSAEKWNDLFVGNAVMHCFAIGLIWGVYENGALKTTFRYMDDGSFTTSDGDEFTLPEGAQIGLVHPIELTKEQISEWSEQLEDFEITQPFEQLKRQVFRPTPEELNSNTISRFDGAELNSLTLVNKMTKLNWYKGYAEDAGFFYYFYRDDFSSRTKNPDGSLSAEGFGVLLTFSGASVVVYDFEGEEVTTEKLIFYKAGNAPAYYDKEQKGRLKISEVSDRYFSEIIMQLSAVLANKQAQE